MINKVGFVFSVSNSNAIQTNRYLNHSEKLHHTKPIQSYNINKLSCEFMP